MQIDNIVITDHGEKRFSERTGLPKRLVTKKAQEALKNGITHAEATGYLRKYFDKLFMQYGSANNVRVYNNDVYVFCGATLVTVFPLPQSLRKTAAKICTRKQKARGNEDV